MGKILVNGNWKKEKGMTLVEVIVSLSIILIVSAAAVSVAIFTSNSLGGAQAKRFFKNEIENIAKLYLEYDETSFTSNFETYLGQPLQTINEHPNQTFYYSTSREIQNNDENYGYKLCLEFSTNKLSLSSFDNNEKAIFAKEVTK